LLSHLYSETRESAVNIRWYLGSISRQVEGRLKNTGQAVTGCLLLTGVKW